MSKHRQKIQTIVDGLLSYIQSPFATDDDIEAVFRNGQGAVQPDAEGNVANAAAQTDILGWLSDQQNRHQTVTLRFLEDHFGSRPYGWARRDIQGVLAELLVQGKAELKQAQAAVDLRDGALVNKMGSRQGLDSYTVRVPRTVNPEALRIARELAQEYLSMAVAPSEPQALFERYRQALGPSRPTSKSSSPSPNRAAILSSACSSRSSGC